MAQIYPIKEDLSDVPYSEIRVYELLEQCELCKRVPLNHILG